MSNRNKTKHSKHKAAVQARSRTIQLQGEREGAEVFNFLEWSSMEGSSLATTLVEKGVETSSDYTLVKEAFNRSGSTRFQEWVETNQFLGIYDVDDRQSAMLDMLAEEITFVFLCREFPEEFAALFNRVVDKAMVNVTPVSGGRFIACVRKCSSDREEYFFAEMLEKMVREKLEYLQSISKTIYSFAA